MMEQSVVAVFDNRNDAQNALDGLLADGFSSANTRITSSENIGSAVSTSQSSGAVEGDSLGDKIARFFGFDDEYEETYSEATRRGHYVLQVDARDSDEVTRAQDIIYRFNPVDIDKKSTEWQASGWTPRTARGVGQVSDANVSAESAGERVIPVTEERMEVGKREVQRGGVRVVTRTVQTPVEEEVALREDRATITRRPVDRAVTDSDRAFQEQSIEIRETAEEAVVAKTARVVEEVRVGKETETRLETVRDTLRKTEVDVEQIGTGGTGTSRSGTTRVPYTGLERRRPGQFAYSGPERRAA